MKTFNKLFIVTRLHSKFILSLVAVLLSNILMAQMRFEIRVQEKKIGVEDAFRVEYVIENGEEISKFTEPQFSEFIMLQGPIQGSSTSIMNGRVSRSVYVSYVIKAKKTGTFTIPPAIAVIDGKRYKTDPVRVQIVEGATGRRPVTRVVPQMQRVVPPGWEDATTPSKELYLKEGEDPIKKINDNLFVRAESNKYSCYVGEPIVATYKLYTRLLSESKVTKRPSLNGFSVYDMTNPESPYARKEMLNGKEFKMYYIRKAQLYPLRAGEYVLEPVEVENKVQLYKRTADTRRSAHNDINDLFRDFFNEVPEGESEVHELMLASKPMTITVLPLPEEHKPSDFNGAVGKFKIEAHLQSAGFETGKSSSLVLTIRGAGNLPMITAPQVQWPAALESFEPSIKEHVNKRKSPIEGEKIFEYAFNPIDTGTVVIPPIRLSFFDPESKQYSTIQTDSLVMLVQPGVGFGKDRPVVAVADPVLSNDNFVIQVLMAGAGFLLMGLLLWQLWNRRSKMMQEKIVVTKKKTVPTGTIIDPKSFTSNGSGKESMATSFQHQEQEVHGAAVASLNLKKSSTGQEDIEKHSFKLNWSSIEMPLSEGNSKAFYRNLSANLWGFFASQFSLTASETNKANLTKKMQAAGVEQDIIEQSLRLFTDCEMALYAPVHSDSDMHALLGKARNIVATLGA